MYKNRIEIGYWDQLLNFIHLPRRSEISVMRFKIIYACAAALMFAACGSAPEDVTDLGGSGTGGLRFPAPVPPAPAVPAVASSGASSGGWSCNGMSVTGYSLGLDQYDLFSEARKTVSASPLG